MSDLTIDLADEITLVDKGPKICLGIACNKYQAPGFWVPLVGPTHTISHFTWSEHGVSNFEKVEGLERFMASRGALTDSNRNRIVDYFLHETDCDYLFQMDDDVRLPLPLRVTLDVLLGHGHPIIAGMYFRGSEPFGSVAFVYKDKEKGPRDGYVSLVDWEPGSMIRVDAVGMGCTLIHRGVFERMQKEFVLVENWRGELRLEHPDDLKEHLAPSDRITTTEEKSEVRDDALFPFYALSYMRTEDMYFCENAKKLGYDIWLDTSLQVEHLHTQPVSRQDFVRLRRESELRSGEQPTIWRAN